MRHFLDLKEIIEVPGASLPFTCELDAERLLSPSLRGFAAPPVGEGRVENRAGVLSLRGRVRADMQCVCDRCGTPVARKKTLDVDVELGDDPDAFPLEADGIDVADVLETAFLLDEGGQTLCREDCLGLCPLCGKNLNDGPCGCVQEVDPRLAVLGQLLDR